MPGSRLTHLNEAGEAHMVDVSAKAETVRTAVAEGYIFMEAGTLDRLREGNLPKGDVIGTARLAGIMAAKRTGDLIPLCHPLPLSKISVHISEDTTRPGLRVEATVTVTARTGVEMEALTAVTVACLTLYDMAKAIDRGMRIEGIRLLEKSGGRSGDWRAG